MAEVKPGIETDTSVDGSVDVDAVVLSEVPHVSKSLCEELAGEYWRSLVAMVDALVFGARIPGLSFGLGTNGVSVMGVNKFGEVRNLWVCADLFKAPVLLKMACAKLGLPEDLSPLSRIDFGTLYLFVPCASLDGEDVTEPESCSPAQSIFGLVRAFSAMSVGHMRPLYFQNNFGGILYCNRDKGWYVYVFGTKEEDEAVLKEVKRLCGWKPSTDLFSHTLSTVNVTGKWEITKAPAFRLL
jgi:hypothetical protein